MKSNSIAGSKTHTSIDMYRHKAEVLEYLKEINKDGKVSAYKLLREREKRE